MPLNLGFYSRSQSYYNKVEIAQYFRGAADYEYAGKFQSCLLVAGKDGLLLLQHSCVCQCHF